MPEHTDTIAIARQAAPDRGGVVSSSADQLGNILDAIPAYADASPLHADAPVLLLDVILDHADVVPASRPKLRHPVTRARDHARSVDHHADVLPDHVDANGDYAHALPEHVHAHGDHADTVPEHVHANGDHVHVILPSRT